MSVLPGASVLMCLRTERSERSSDGEVPSARAHSGRSEERA